MIHVMIPFEIKKESVEEAVSVIHDFVAQIKKTEPGTLFYKSLQQEDHPTRFVHVMSFIDKEAREYHKQTSHCATFVERLYPLCLETPKAIAYTEVK